MKRIYLDYAATTPVDPEVLTAMQPYFSERFGNPGSLHSFGQEAITAVDRSRETIARALGVDFRNIIFTGSATEANNLALRGVVDQFRNVKKKAPRIIISAIEHESILETAKDLERDGIDVVYIPVDAMGIVDEKKIKESLTLDTAIVSIMYAQNEIGTVTPIGKIGAMIRASRGKELYPIFHTDAVQAFQFLPCVPRELNVDLMTLSAHKIYGPKGVGALYIKDRELVYPMTTGGGQEFGLRSGTENVPSIVGFVKAVEQTQAVREKESMRISGLRDRLWQGIKENFPKVEMNGLEKGGQKLPNLLNIYFPGHGAEQMLVKFDQRGLAASSGSACRSRALQSSYVLEALGHSKERARSSIRFSLGRPTSAKDIESAIRIIKEAL